MIKTKIFEVEQPQSEGEKNFKDMHKAVNHKNLVPGITDQDHVFNGSTKPYDNKYHTGYKPGEDRTAYDKSLKRDDAVTNNGYEAAKVEEATGSMIGKTHKDIQHKASFSSSNVSDMIRKEKQRKAAAEGKRNSSLSSRASSNRQVNSENVQLEAVILDESKWTEKNLPSGNYNQGEHSEKGDIHHIEVHPEVLKKHGISHQVSHAGEYGQTHHFEHPSHGKVSVYQSDLNKKTGNPIISVRTFGKPGAKPVAHKFAKKLEGKTMHVYNESVNENYDDTPEEVSMIRTELKSLVSDAQSLLDNMPSDMHIEPWVQSKIAVAKSMVSGVHDYMLYSDEDDMPSDIRPTMPSMPSMSNPYIKSEEFETVDEKLSDEKLKKFAKLAPPYDKITHADKIIAAKKKEAGAKVLPEASKLGSECTKCGEGHYQDMNGKMICDECGHVGKADMKEASVIKSHAMNMARQSIHKLKPKMKHSMNVKAEKPKDTIKMESVELISAEEKARLDSIMNSDMGE